MKILAFISIAAVLGFLLMYFIASKLNESTQTMFACLVICILASVYRNLGQRS